LPGPEGRLHLAYQSGTSKEDCIEGQTVSAFILFREFPVLYYGMIDFKLLSGGPLSRAASFFPNGENNLSDRSW